MPAAIQLIDQGEMRTQGRKRRHGAPRRGGTLLEIRGVETGYGTPKILRGIDMKVGVQGIVALQEGSHKDIYAFLLLIFVLMVRPTGLMGHLAKVKA